MKEPIWLKLAMSKHPSRPTRAAARAAAPAFTPSRPRARHDGWTPERQARFIDTLAGSGCVAEACAAAGMSRAAAYALRTRVDAQGFRVAWDAALDLAIRRLSDECFSRALQGEAVPHFYQGEQVGEHRRYDNRLAMFLLRYRDPLRYAATLDQMVYSGHAETAALAFARARDRMAEEAHGVADTPAEAPLPPFATQPMHEASRQSCEVQQAMGNGAVGGSWMRQERVRTLRADLHAQETSATAAARRSSPAGGRAGG